VDVSGFEGSTGPFTIRTEASKSAPLPAGGPIEGGVDVEAGFETFFLTVGPNSEDELVVVSPDSQLDPVVELSTPTGTFTVDGGGAGEPETLDVGSLRPQNDQEWFVTVSGFEGSTGAYSIQRTAVERLSIEADVTGSIASGEVVNYALDVDQGPIKITAEPGDDFDVIVTVKNKIGDQIAYADSTGPGGAEHAALEVSDSSDLTVEVSGYESSSGAFTIRVESLETTPIEPNEPPTAGEIAEAGEAQTYSLTVGPDSDEQAIAVTPSEEFDAVMEISTPFGNFVIDSPAEGAREVFYVRSQDLYEEEDWLVTVSGYEDYTGAYTISFGDLGAAPLSPGTDAAGVIDAPGSVATYTIIADERAPIRVTAAPEGGLDVVITIRDEFGTELSSARQSGPAASSLSIVAAPAEGVRVVEVSGAQGTTGPFTIRAEILEPVPLSPDGAPTAGEIVAADDVRTYSLTVGPDSGDHVIAVVPSTGLDVSMEISTPFGTIPVDSAGDGEREVYHVAELDPFEDQEWLVTVSGYEGSAGTYAISFGEPITQPLPVATPTAGELANPGGIATYTVSGDENAPIRITVDSEGSLDAVVTVRGEFGIELSSARQSDAGSSTLSLVAGSADGGRTVEVSGSDGSTGAFAIRADVIEVEPLASDGTATSGEIAAADTHTYSVTVGPGSTDQVITVIPSADLDTVVDVSTPFGGLQMDVPEPGAREVIYVGALPPFEDEELLITVSGFDGSTGSYTISIGEDISEPLPVATPTAGAIGIPGAIAYYSIDADQDGPITVTVLPEGGFDAVVTVRDTFGFELASEDSGGAGDAESTTVEGFAGELVRVEVSGFDGSTGGFTVVADAGE
jgi:hypothetical protein